MSKSKAMVGVVTHEDNVIVVDRETGEVIDITSSKTIKYKAGAHYLKVFCEHPLFREKMPHSTRTLLHAVASMVPYASLPSQCIHLSGAALEGIEKDYDLSTSTIKRGLKWLCEHDAIRRIGRGTYQVNPYLYARGPSRDVLKLQREWDGMGGE